MVAEGSDGENVAEESYLEKLLRLGVLEPTDKPVNVLMPGPLFSTEPKATPNPPDDFETFWRKSSQDHFWATLGHSIQAYSGLEQSMCTLFATLSGMSSEIANILFYKIQSSRLRDLFLENLVKNKYGNKYDKFWDSLSRLIGQVTERRNQIIHGRAGVHPEAVEIRLVLPHLRDIKDMDLYINTSHLSEFIDQCRYLSTLMQGFWTINDQWWCDRMDPAILKTWQGIYQQEVTYPAPSTHPIYQSGKEFVPVHVLR
jgi:hypothetical protein